LIDPAPRFGPGDASGDGTPSLEDEAIPDLLIEDTVLPSPDRARHEIHETITLVNQFDCSTV
jgi:hypothetical protein